MFPSLLLALSGTFSPSPVEHSDAIIATIATEIHTTIEVAPNLRDHHLYLDRRGAAPLVVLRQIATALHASLVKEGSVYAIRRTTMDRTDTEKRRAARRRGWIDAALDRDAAFRKRRAETGSLDSAIIETFDQHARESDEIARGRRHVYSPDSEATLLPAAALLEGLLERIGRPALAQLASDQIVVFEDGPVASARPLPPHDDLLSSYGVSVEDLRRSGLDDRLIRFRTIAGRTVDSGTLPESPQGIVKLRLQCGVGGNGMSIRLDAYDRANHRVDGARLLIGPEPVPLSDAELLRQEAARPGSRWAPLSATAQAAVRATKMERLAPVPQWFLDPVRHEPLNLFVGEAVAAMTAKENGCVVTDVADGLWGEVLGCVAEERLNLDALSRSLAMWLPYERVTGPDGTVWRPVDPDLVGAHRAKRDVLGRFARAAYAMRTPDLRTRARLFHETSVEPSGLASEWDALARRASPLAHSSSSLSPNALALLGAVSDGDWDRLTAGAKLTTAALGVERELRRLLTQEALPIEGRSPVADLYRYPTELYPNDDWGSTPLSLHTSNVALARIWLNGWPEGELWGSAETMLAGHLRVRPESFRLKDGVLLCTTDRETREAEFAKYRIRRGTRETAALTIGLPRDLSIRLQAQTTDQADGESFAYADLPERIRRANWEKAYADGLAAYEATRTRPSPPASADHPSKVVP